MKFSIVHICLMFLFAGILFSCQNNSDPNPPGPDINQTMGYQLLNQLPGIWNGPVTSTTALGSYSEWIVDFRPISENQISAKNELDSLNDINMSFFIALYNNQYHVCFRNGGSFNGMKRISYFRCDSVNESAGQNYYRFVEIKTGMNRAYAEVLLRNNGDSLILRTYTNIYNTLPAPTLHMTWSAKLVDTTSTQPAINQHSFPQKSMTRDFTSSFNTVSEAIFYGLSNDPYPEDEQPSLGVSSVSYTYAAAYTPNPAKKVFLIITTQPLIVGFSFVPANLIYRSRYVILAANDPNFNFNYMHPGDYYLYALYDNDDNLIPNSGDWVSILNTSFTLINEGNVSPTTEINFTIP